MTFFIWILQSFAVAALPLQLSVESPKLHYQMSVSTDAFRFSSATSLIEEKIKPCGAKAYELYVQKIESTLKRELAKAPTKAPNFIRVSLNKETFYVPALSRSGTLLSRLENDANYLTGEAIYRCSKK